MSKTEQHKSLPLAGVRVIDWTTHVATPRAGRILADLGAEVIKIEAADGDAWRTFGQSYKMPCTDEENFMFTGENSNKKFISLNMKSSEGKEIFFKLLESADVFLSNVRFRSLQKMGVFYDDIKDRFPKLICCHFSGFGYEGPDAERPGFDISAFWSKTGMLKDWVPDGAFPIKPAVAFGDIVTGSLVYGGIMTALFAREKTGKGTFVTTSLYNSGIWANLCNLMVVQEPAGYHFPEDPAQPANPFSHYYECADGRWVTIAILGYNKDYNKVCRMLYLEEYIDDPRFCHMEQLKQENHLAAFYYIIKHAMAKLTLAEWEARFQEFDVVYEVIARTTDILTDEQAWANGYLEKVTFPSGATAAIPAVPLHFSNYDVKAITPTGSIGSCTDAIIAELGYSSEQIHILREQGTIK